MLDGLEVDCGRIPDIIRVEEVVAINELITDPDNFENPQIWEEGNTITHAELGGPSFEIGREEDYHEVASVGIIESLVETMLPYECQENNDVLWLTAFMMAEICQNQAFYEGNKRTAYMVGTMFLIKCQLLVNDEARYPMLDKELTDKLSLLAVSNSDEEESISRDEFYYYLKERLTS